MTYVDGNVYVLRGAGSRTFWKYNIINSNWTDMANTLRNVNRGGALIYTGGNYIYALRGASGTRFWRYDIAANTWSNMQNTPGNVQNGGALAYTGGNYIYAFRGDNTDDFWRYDISANTWSVMQDAPANVRGGGSLLYTGGNYIYAFRGNGSNNFWAYHIENNSWISLQNTPQNVSHGGSLSIGDGNQIYALRGNSSGAFWVYDIASDIWSVKPSAPGNVRLGGSLAFMASPPVTDCEYVLSPGELGFPITNDNCPPLAGVVNDAPLSLPIGVTTITWTATDGAGNTTECVQIVTLIDTIAPQLHGIPSDAMYLCEPIPPPPVIGETIFATDNCDNNVVIEFFEESTQAFNGTCESVIYEIFRTWVATDASGNSDTVQQVINVICECCINGIDDTGNGLIDEDDPHCPCSAPQYRMDCELGFFYFVPSIWQMNPNHNGNPNLYTHPSSFIITSPFENAHINVRTSDGTTFNEDHIVTQGTSLEVQLHWDLVQTPNYNVPELNRGFIIESDQLLQVIYRLEGSNNKNLITIKGEQALGRRFRAGSQTNLCGTASTAKKENHFISVMAVEDSTMVTFTFTAQMKGLPQNHTVMLNAFETYLVIDDDVNQTVTGSLIVSNKDIAVISGSQHSARTCYPGQHGRDGGVDQLVSSCNVGTDYVVFRGIDSYNPSVSNYVVITPVAAATQVFINGSDTPAAILNPGEYFTYNLPGPDGSVHYIRTSQPAYCFQFGSVQSNGEIGMALAAPIYGCNGDKYIEFMRFPNSTTNMVTIIISNVGLATLTLNGNHYSTYTSEQSVPGLPEYKTVTFTNAMIGDYNIVESDEYFHAAQFVGTSAGGTFGYLTSFKDKIDIFHPETLQPTVSYFVDTVCGGESYFHCLVAFSCGGGHYISNIVQGDNTGGLVIYPDSICFSYIGKIGFYGMDSIVVMVSDQLGFTQPVCLSFYVCGISPVLTCPDDIHVECPDDLPPPYANLEEFLIAGGSVYTECDSIVPDSFTIISEISDDESCPETIIRTYQIESECGFIDTCEQQIIINDLTPPTFNLPADTIYCVEDLINALYNPTGTYPIDDLTYPRPDYYLHLTGNTILDLVNLHDNCTEPDELIIEWQVDFGITGVVDLTGSGQLSEPPPIYFPVGTNAILFTVTDECGNSSSDTLIMVVRQRPDIDDAF